MTLPGRDDESDEDTDSERDRLEPNLGPRSHSARYASMRRWLA